jgi:glycosyltransferase involved in cell wall biosynthesis
MTASVVHVTGIAGRASMGISSVVWGLCKAQLSRGDQVTVWCCDKSEALESARDFDVPPEAVAGFPIMGPRRLCYSPRMYCAATDWSGDRAVLHQHGIWTAISRAANKWRRRSRPTVLAPHGSLEPWAISKSAARKALALRWYEQQNLRETSCLHATSIAEIDDFRRYGLTAPIALIPNGVSDDWLQMAGEGDRFRERLGIARGRRLMLFLSRMTPKKGLPMLVSAWAAERGRLRDWSLIIAGIDEFSHREQLVSQVDSAGLTESILFTGPMYGMEKRDAFAASEVFVLPSHSEGSPMAVLDALGAGVPVLTTQKTPWQDLERHGCGWWVPDDEPNIAEALVKISQESAESLMANGTRGKSLVSREYSWKSAAEKCSSLYAWLLGSGSMPGFVILN